MLREEVAEALHEPVEVGLLAALALLEHVVELGEHVLHARELLGRHLRHALLQLVEHRVEQLLLQLLHQLLELLARRVVHPVVLLQLADAAGEIGRELLELLAPLLRELFEQLLAALVARLARVVEAAVDAFALLFDDLVEPLGDVLVHAAEVVAVELLAAPLAQLLEHLAHALDVAALAVLEALLHHAAQRGVQVAVVEEIVGHLLEQRVGVEIEPDLRAVPPRVLELAHRGHRYLPAGIAASRRISGSRARMRYGSSVRTSGGAPAASSTQAEGAAPASDWYALGTRGPGSAERRRATASARATPRTSSCTRSTGSRTTASSIDWARIEPEEGRRDDLAIEHYREILTAARAAGVNPWVCLHHFTLPGWFTEIGEGGFVDDRARSYYWPRHVAFCAETFGDLVYGWKPINEPGAYSSIYRTGGRSPRSLDWGRVFDMLGRCCSRSATRGASCAAAASRSRRSTTCRPIFAARRDGAGATSRGRARRGDLERVDARRPRRRARAPRTRGAARSRTCRKRATSSASRTTRRPASTARAGSRRTRPARASGRWATRRGAKDSASCCTGCTTSCRAGRC